MFNKKKKCNGVEEKKFKGRTFIKGQPKIKNIITQNYNEKKVFKQNEVTKIIVDSSFVDVYVHASDKTDKITVKLHGCVKIDGNINYNLSVQSSILRVFLDYSGFCSYNENEFKFEITVPKKIFNKISVHTSSSNIFINDVISSRITARSFDGNIFIASSSDYLSLSSETGKITCSLTPINKEIAADVSTISGNISVKFNRITQIHITADANIRDKIKNIFAPTEHGNEAFFDVTTESGEINIS